LRISGVSNVTRPTIDASAQQWPDVHRFLDAASDFLTAREADHCLMLGLASTIANHPEIYREPQFWTVHDGGRVVGAALRTPPQHVVVSHVDEPRGLTALAEAVLAGDELPGVLGPTAAAGGFASLWSARTGRAAERAMQERVFRLDRVIAPHAAPGRCRDAEERDRSRLAAWIDAFAAEALAVAPSSDGAEIADRFLRRAGRIAYVWDDAGEIVAFAGVSGPTPRGIRIGPVYTPSARRGRGYASNLVAEVSQRQLDAGRSFCFLFTDLANPTSNRIYQAIGYAPVVDVDQYRFPPA
jgi:predicted GNAT family acetyltransferase